MTQSLNEGKSTFRRLMLLTTAVVLAVAGWFLLGESESVVAAESDNARPNSEIAAKVGDTEITMAEIEEAASGQLMGLERQRYDIISTAVKNQARERMIELEAKKKGLDKEALLKAEVEDKAAALPEEQIDAFIQERSIRQPKEQIAPQIRNYLAYEAFIANLESSYDVEYFVEPFRVEVEAIGPSKGNKDAPITIVEFSDFECPYCSRVNPTLQKVQEAYGDHIQIFFRQFPLAMHANAPKAAEAGLCANDQEKFWEMHDAMFAEQKNLSVDGLKGIAGKIEGLDGEAFAQCLDSSKYKDAVAADLKAGAEAGVSGTPAFFINGRFLNGAQPFEQFSEVIDEELERKGVKKGS